MRTRNKRGMPLHPGPNGVGGTVCQVTTFGGPPEYAVLIPGCATSYHPTERAAWDRLRAVLETVAVVHGIPTMGGGAA